MLILTLLSWLLTFLLIGVVCNVVGRQFLEGRTGADNAALTFLSVTGGRFPYCSGRLWANRDWSWIYPWAFLLFFAEWIRFGGKRVVHHPAFNRRLQALMMESTCVTQRGQGSDRIVRNGRLGCEWSGIHIRAEEIAKYVTSGNQDDMDRWAVAHGGRQYMSNFAIAEGFEGPIWEPDDKPWIRDAKLAKHLFGDYANAASVAEIQMAQPQVVGLVASAEEVEEVPEPEPVVSVEEATPEPESAVEPEPTDETDETA